MPNDLNDNDRVKWGVASGHSRVPDRLAFTLAIMLMRRIVASHEHVSAGY